MAFSRVYILLGWLSALSHPDQGIRQLGAVARTGNPQLLEIAVVDVIAAPFWNSIELNAVGELHGLTLQELPVLPLAPFSPLRLGIMGWEVLPGGKVV